MDPLCGHRHPAGGAGKDHLHHSPERVRGRPLVILGALLALLGAYFVLIVAISNDTGSALVYAFIFVVMLFCAGVSIWWVLGAAVLLLLVAPYLWYYILTDNYRTRILAMFDPARVDPTGQGVTWQPNLSKAAIASGGLFGQGLYHGEQTQSGVLPLQNSDFIFAVAGEELGILGCILILALLTVIIIRVVQVGLRSQSRLGALTCMGVAALTLPFFSYGGSSIVTLYAAMGIVSGIKMKPKPTMFLP